MAPHEFLFYIMPPLSEGIMYVLIVTVASAKIIAVKLKSFYITTFTSHGPDGFCKVEARKAFRRVD